MHVFHVRVRSLLSSPPCNRTRLALECNPVSFLVTHLRMNNARSSGLGPRRIRGAPYKLRSKLSERPKVKGSQLKLT